MIDEANKVNIRMTLAVQVDKPLSELKALYDWIIGSGNNIMPVKDFKVIQQ